MERPVEFIRAAIEALAVTLEPNDYALIPTSRGLEAIVDKQIAARVLMHRWYAVISRGGHVHAVADVAGRRITLQRYVLTLADPELSIDDAKQVSFVNKNTFDCRISNLADRIGRTAVMRNRRKKRNSSSDFKGVRKMVTKAGQVQWRAEIKSEVGRLFLGSYDDERWAAAIYDAAAFLLFDNAALYNLPEICPHPDALMIASERIERRKNRQSTASASTA